MKTMLAVLGALALGAQAQTTNSWVGLTDTPAAGSWADPGNWSPDTPDTDTEVADFTADFTTNVTVTLDMTTAVNGLIFNDTNSPGSTRQTLTLAAGSPPGRLLFAGASPLVSVVSGGEFQPVTIASATDPGSFTKQGAGWLQLTNLETNNLPAAVTVAGGVLLLNQAGTDLVVSAGGFAKSGAGQFVSSVGMALTGGGSIAVNQGRMEVRAGSTNFTGNIVVSSSGQYVGRSSPYSSQFGDTNGATTVNGGGQAKFQDPAAFVCAEAWNLNGFRGDGSLQLDFADATLTGPIRIGTNTHLNINTYNHAIRHTRIQGVIDDGAATGGVTFTIGYGGAASGADLQWTNFLTASRFILSGSNTYGGPTYVSVRNNPTITTNLTLTMELTNGNNRLPATTVLTLGGQPPGITGSSTANGRLVLDGVSQELAGLASSGNGTNNAVVSGTPDLCRLTLNVAASTTHTFNGTLGGVQEGWNSLALIKRGSGTQVLGGANAYTGATVVAAGILQAAHSAALGSAAEGTVVSNFAQLRLTGGITVDDALALNGSGVSGSNLGALRNIGGTNAVNGAITFGGAVLGRIQVAAGALTLRGGMTSSNLTVMLATAAGAATTVESNALNVGTAILQAHDPGTLYLNVAGNVMGTFNPAWGDTVVIGAANALPTNVTLVVGYSAPFATAGSGALDLNGYDVACGSFSSSYSNGVALPHTLVVRNSHATPAALIVHQDTNTIYEGRLLENLSLVKGGAGSLTLAGTNTFSNTTVVAGGTLALAGNGSLACTAIAVAAGATLSVTGRADGALTLAAGQTLGGAGTVLGLVTNAGTILPGASAGTLTIVGGYVQEAAGALRIEIGAGAHDVLAVTGGLATLGGALEVSRLNGFDPPAGSVFTAMTAVLIGGAFATTNLPPPSGGKTWAMTNDGGAVILTVSSSGLTGYDAWAAGYGFGVGSETGDPDGDRLLNLLEYSQGSDPTVSNGAAVVSGSRSNGEMRLIFNVVGTAVDISYVAESTYCPSNGAPWTPVWTNLHGTPVGSNFSGLLGPGTNRITVFDLDPAATRRAMRLRVTRP